MLVLLLEDPARHVSFGQHDGQLCMEWNSLGLVWADLGSGWDDSWECLELEQAGDGRNMVEIDLVRTAVSVLLVRRVSHEFRAQIELVRDSFRKLQRAQPQRDRNHGRA